MIQLRFVLASLLFLVPVWAGCHDRPGARAMLPFEVADKVIPNAAMTDEATVTVLVDLITISNETAGALTVTIQSKTGTVELLKDISLAANSTVVIAFGGYGKKFVGGISWQASAAGLNGYMYGCKAP